MGIEVIAQTRKLQGTGASRRLRHSGKVPGILYGGKTPPVSIELEHNALYHQVRMEKFHASILDLVLDGKKEQVLLRNVNMHPWRVEVHHIDFQRVLADQKVHMRVPLHFVNAEISPAIKLSAAVISHVMTEIHVRCLPADIPEYVEVDLKDLEAGNSIHVEDLKLGAGVEAATHGNPAVAVAQIPRGAVEEETEAAAAAEAAPAGAVPASKQKEEPAKADAKGGDAKGGDAKGGDAKPGGDKGGKAAGDKGGKK